MPVYIYEPDAFKKMALVEGPEWERHVKDFGSCSFHAFLDLWNAKYKDAQSKYSKETLEAIHLRQPDGQVTIYGLGGYGRYYVKGTGEICLIEIMYEAQEPLDEARNQGFTIVLWIFSLHLLKEFVIIPSEEAMFTLSIEGLSRLEGSFSAYDRRAGMLIGKSKRSSIKPGSGINTTGSAS